MKRTKIILHFCYIEFRVELVAGIESACCDCKDDNHDASHDACWERLFNRLKIVAYIISKLVLSCQSVGFVDIEFSGIAIQHFEQHRDDHPTPSSGDYYMLSAESTDGRGESAWSVVIYIVAMSDVRR